MKLFYKTTSNTWLDGLPIGEGRLAAMVVNDKDNDRFFLNHEWLWRGTKEARDRHAEKMAHHLPMVRELLAKGEYREGTIRANNFFGGGGGQAGKFHPEDYEGRTPHLARLDNYQPAGTLIATFDGEQTLKERVLDMKNGLVSEIRERKGAPITAEHYADCHCRLLSFKWDSEEPFTLTFTYDRHVDPHSDFTFTVEGNIMYYRCQYHGGQKYIVKMVVDTDGTLVPQDNALRVENTKTLRVITDIGVEECGYEEELTRQTIPTDWLMSRHYHMVKFSATMSRVSFKLDSDPELEKLSVDERLTRLKAGEVDDGLVTLYFQFGRYLLMASCINGDLPANLQGKWNQDIVPAWNSDYHLDINLQMNYWAAEAAGMGSCIPALVKWLERMRVNGREAAKNLYNCRGFYIPLSSDAWASSSPEAWGYGVWISGAGWLGEHLWWHYIYSGDTEFLKEVAYPYFAELTEFYEDYMFEGKDGKLVISPSQSPEHFFRETADFYTVGISENCAMDVQMAYNTFRYAILGAEALGVDADKVENWKALQAKLPEFKIGSDGRLLEWGEERDEWEPTHRHLSHLYGAYPSDLFTPKARPEQYEACIKSLEVRTNREDVSGGWGQAWASCMWARFGKADKFYRDFFGLVRDFSSNSLLDLHHNPYKTLEGYDLKDDYLFQIDGNFGAIAAVIEALCGYFDEEVHLLRALPENWQTGELCGIRVPGGHDIDLKWKDGKLTEVSVRIGYQGSVALRFPDGRLVTLSGNVGEVKSAL